MRKIIFMITTLLVFNTQAALKSFNLANTVIQFEQGSGFLSVEKFDLNFDFGKINLDQYLIDVTKSDGDLVFKKDNTRFQLYDVEESILEAIDYLELSSLSTSGEANKFLRFQTDGGFIALGGDVHKFSNVALSCEQPGRNDTDLISYLKPCFFKGALRIPRLELNSKTSQNLNHLLKNKHADIDSRIEPEKINFLKPRRIEDINLDVLENNFNLSLKVKLLFKLKVKVQGLAKYDKDDQEVIFDIQKAKLGFLNVKKLLLNFIAKENIKNLEVRGSQLVIKV